MPPRRKNARRALAAISEEAHEEPETAQAMKPDHAASAELAQLVAELDLQGPSLSLTHVEHAQRTLGAPFENYFAKK